MIVLNLKLDGVYGFDDFEIDLTYPKKVVNSIIEEEHLEGRERFRYKKVAILMGSNATGKTSLGKALLKISTYINTNNPNFLFDLASREQASFSIDFINEGFSMHRISATIDRSNLKVEISYRTAEIDMMDSYEMCVAKLKDHSNELKKDPDLLRKNIGTLNCRFAYPEIQPSLSLDGIDRNIFLKTLRAVIGTLDPTLENITISSDLKDTYIIRRGSSEIIIQEGKLLNGEILSSGTKEGIDVAIFLAAMLSKKKTFYYCDEHFSYIQSDIEKRIFGMMLERVSNNEQLIFTTHNSDILDLNLPKHSFIFLCKKKVDDKYQTRAISASSILKRNTDSVRSAVENDVFGSLPDDSLLDELESELANE